MRPCNSCFLFLEWSTKGRHSFGATCAIWLEVVLIASCEALDAHSTERFVWNLDFASTDEVLVRTEPGFYRTLLASSLPWLLPGLLSETTRVNLLIVGGAALATPTAEASGFNLGTLGVGEVFTKGRCCATPRGTTSVKDVLSAKHICRTCCHASRNVIFTLTFIVIISFSPLQAGHALEYAR